MDKRERFLELMDQSSERALSALAGFLTCELDSPGRAREWDVRELEQLRRAPDSRVIGLAVNLDGAIGGHLLMLLDRGAAREIVDPLVRAHTGEARELWACSALLEAANVVFSAAAGALGDAVGVVVFPSIPHLYEEASSEFRRVLIAPGGEGLGIYAVDTSCADVSGGRTPLSLLWVPTHSD